MENQSSTDNQNTSQIEPAIESSPAPQNSEKPKDSYWVIASVVCTLLLIGGFGWYFFKAKSNQPSPEITNTISSSPTVVPAGGAGKVAYVMKKTIGDVGDIYVSASDGSDKQKLTISGDIETIMNWSPDNTHILAHRYVKKESGPASDYVVVNAQTGVEISVPIIKTGIVQSDFVWTTNSEITYINDDTMYAVTIGGNQRTVWKLPSDIESPTSYYLNKTMDMFVHNIGTESIESMTDAFVYNIKTKQNTQITTGGKVSILGWMGKDILYQQNKSLWRTSIDGKDKKKLVDLGEWNVLRAVISEDGTEFVYFAIPGDTDKSQTLSKLFRYVDTTSKSIELTTLGKDEFVAYLSLSRDARFAAFTPQTHASYNASAQSVSIDMDANTSTKLCDTACYSPVWQN